MELLYFSAPWCGPCQTFRPLLFRTLEDYPAINVRQINVDDELALAYDNQVMSIPVLICRGQRLEGAVNEALLRAWLDQL